MKNKNPKISYDKESAVLSIMLGKNKSVDSEIQGNTVIDYDRKGKIAKINFYDFNFSSFKDKLKYIKDFADRANFSLQIK